MWHSSLYRYRTTRHGLTYLAAARTCAMLEDVVQSMLAAFQKLLSAETGKQHTYIESDNVRYVLQIAGNSETV